MHKFLRSFQELIKLPVLSPALLPSIKKKSANNIPFEKQFNIRIYLVINQILL